MSNVDVSIIKHTPACMFGVKVNGVRLQTLAFLSRTPVDHSARPFRKHIDLYGRSHKLDSLS